MLTKEIVFTIVCATFNRSNLLRRAINSVLKQQFSNFELIIVNDGSTDDTRDTVKSIKDERIVYIEHENNLGSNAAFNTGVQKAKGKYVALLGDDDELSERALQMAFDIFNESPYNKMKIVIFNCVDVETNRISGKYLEKETVVKYDDLLCQKLSGDYWFIVERSIFPSGKIFDEDSWAGAGMAWMRLLRVFDAYYIPKIAYYAYRKHDSTRLTNIQTNSKNWQLHEYTTKKLLGEFGEDMKAICPRIYSKQLENLAFYQLMNKNFRTARLNLILSLKKEFTISAFGLLLLTFLGNRNQILFIYERLWKNFFMKIPH